MLLCALSTVYKNNKSNKFSISDFRESLCVDRLYGGL